MTRVQQHVPMSVPGAVADLEALEVHAPFDGGLIATVDQAGA